MSLSKLASYFEAEASPLLGAKTIQVLMLRNLLDFTILRTEETRELNTAITPASLSRGEPVSRLAFLATKQRAAESRTLAELLRTAAQAFGYPAKDCYLKDFLCMECPRCTLFGATNVSGGGERANIKHRLEYSTAFSLSESADSGTATTFNAVDEKTLSTGQALGVRFAATPGTVFPSIVTLRSVTKDEFIWAIKTLMASKSYGAESRIGGDCRNLIIGFVAGWEEIITSLEWCLELSARSLEDVKVGEVLQGYKAMAANQNQVRILDEGETQAVVDEVSAFTLEAGFVTRSFEAAKQFRASQLGQAGGRTARRR